MTWQSSQYRATEEVKGVAPPASPWELFLSAGEQGEPGDRGKKGEPGPANVLQIGTVTTLPAGSNATAEITGESPEQVLNLSLPQGEQGGKGDPGPANTLTIGTVMTLDPGEQASAEISGESPSYTLNLAIPRGEQGIAAIPEQWDSPGSTVFGYYAVAAGESYLLPGDIVPASKINVGNVSQRVKDGVSATYIEWATRPSGGSWRLQGSTGRRDTDASITSLYSALCFLRVDSVPAAPKFQTFAAPRATVRNCQYADKKCTMIDCEILVSGKWIPFTASAADSTDYGPRIFAEAQAGK